MELLTEVIRMQSEIESLKSAAKQSLDEPFLSETTRRIGVCNNHVMNCLVRAGWELQAAQCTLENHPVFKGHYDI